MLLAADDVSEFRAKFPKSPKFPNLPKNTYPSAAATTKGYSSIKILLFSVLPDEPYDKPYYGHRKRYL